MTASPIIMMSQTSRAGNAVLAERYFEQMKKSGLKPTEGVYTELLRAYAMYVPTSTSLLLQLDDRSIALVLLSEWRILRRSCLAWPIPFFRPSDRRP